MRAKSIPDLHAECYVQYYFCFPSKTYLCSLTCEWSWPYSTLIAWCDLEASVGFTSGQSGVWLAIFVDQWLVSRSTRCAWEDHRDRALKESSLPKLDSDCPTQVDGPRIDHRSWVDLWTELAVIQLFLAKEPSSCGVSEKLHEMSRLSDHPSGEPALIERGRPEATSGASCLLFHLSYMVQDYLQF